MCSYLTPNYVLMLSSVPLKSGCLFGHWKKWLTTEFNTNRLPNEMPSSQEWSAAWIVGPTFRHGGLPSQIEQMMATARLPITTFSKCELEISSDMLGGHVNSQVFQDYFR